MSDSFTDSQSTSILKNELGTLGGVQFDMVAWAPHEADVDLSFACMFEHEAAGAALDGGLMQSLRLGARSVAFAPNLLDAGIVAPHALRIASDMLRGVAAGLALAAAANRAGFAPPCTLQRWSFDTGPAHFAGATAEFARTFAELASAPAATSAAAPASVSASSSDSMPR